MMRGSFCRLAVLIMLAAGFWVHEGGAGTISSITIVYSGNTMGYIQPCER